MKANRAGRIFLAALILFLSFAAAPVRSTAEPSASIGIIRDGVWRLEPANYTYRVLQNTKELNLSGKGIRAIEGIEHLGGLVRLDLSYNELESLDLSTCRKLSELNCSHNRLSSLDLSNNSRLKVLDCSDNPLGELSVARTKSLQTLDCRNCGLKVLDTSANRTLTELYCSGNELSAIETGNLRRLKKLDVARNAISTLDVSKNEGLTGLDCSGNPDLKSLNLSANRRIRELHTDGTAIDSLDLTAQRGLAEAFTNRNGYRYEVTEHSRTWKPEDGLLTANPEATIRISSEIVLLPDDGEYRSRVVLPGYRQYKPGEFSERILTSSYEDMCHYFGMTVGPSGSVFRKANEEWFYENAHTVVEKAGLAVQAWWEESVKQKAGARAFTVFDRDGNFKFRCIIDYMANEEAVEYVRRLNKDHEKPDAEDLWGHTGQVEYFVCGNAVVTMEGIPSAAYEKTPTLESYLLSAPATGLYLIR